jgi:two-component system nitrogen regulation sensor histidine kinase NtrY
VPIQRLAEGTEAVARGNYDFQVRAVGDDEIAFLVRSFNKMTSDLKQSRFDAERRRVLIETILGNLAVGVIALDKDGRITSVNTAGTRMFGLGDPQEVRSKPIQEIIDSPTLDALMRVVHETAAAHNEALVQPEVEIEITTDGQRRKLIATAGNVETADGKELGTVLIFDDITDLVQAQHMAAWREVARRIAHEIKNPLTPLQLCAQRLQRLLGGSEHSTAVRESTETIVEHVASIKRLADEFSKFARMPTIQYEETNLNDLISSVLGQYAESHPQIIFTYIAGSDALLVLVDKEQIRRVILNVIDNAVAALEENPPTEDSPSITVKTQVVDEGQTVIVEVLDTGPGIPQAQKNRIFEPYFTTREQGTGLGLAIVSSIVADHGGSIRVFDNVPRGTRMLIEFPVLPQETRQRKLTKSV